MKPRRFVAGVWRAWRAARRRWLVCALLAAGAAGAAGALVAAVRALAAPRLELADSFARVRPADLAHLLADISANTHPIPGAWSLEEESGNYSSWRYAVSYSCGARCAGRVAVEAHELHELRAPRHGLADAHRVLVRRLECSALPLLPWPLLCEELETESVVTGEESGGARLQQTLRSRCAAGAALLRACAYAGAPELRALARAQRRRLRQLLHEPAGADAAFD